MTDVETVAVWDDQKDQVTIFAVNRDLEEDITLEADLRSFSDSWCWSTFVLENGDMNATNFRKSRMWCPRWSLTEISSKTDSFRAVWAKPPGT